MHLTFANGNMTGEGNDDVGRFLIKGRYDAPTEGVLLDEDLRRRT